MLQQTQHSSPARELCHFFFLFLSSVKSKELKLQEDQFSVFAVAQVQGSPQNADRRVAVRTSVVVPTLGAWKHQTCDSLLQKTTRTKFQKTENKRFHCPFVRFRE